jgi:ubiquinone biosynthesis protein
MLAKRISPRRLLRATGMSAWHLINIAKTAPRQLRDALRGLSRGQWQLNVQHQNLDYLANEIDRASNRIAFSVVIGATILGSSILFNVKDSLFGLEIRYLAIAGYVIAGIMGLGLVIAILRSGKLS